MKKRDCPTERKLESFVQQFGVISDDAIGRMAGVSQTSVMKYRNKLGIAPFDFREIEGYCAVQNEPFRKKCACGKPATSRFKKQDVCGDCLRGDFKERTIDDFVHSGRTNLSAAL
jgi:hypothetical protein